MKIKKPDNENWSMKKIFVLLSAILVISLALYGINTGLRIYRIYTSVYEPLEHGVGTETDPEEEVSDGDENNTEDTKDVDSEENADTNGDSASDPSKESTSDDVSEEVFIIEDFEPVEYFPIAEDSRNSVDLVPITGESIWDFQEIDQPFYESRSSDKNSNHINILLLGFDENIDQPGRSDSIIIAHFNKETKKTALLSIPRDTYIQIPHHGFDKAGHAVAYGGTSLSKEAIENYLDIAIDYYIRVDMTGFARSVDALGGIAVHVQERLVEEGGELLFEPGVVHMSGEDALAYTRARKLEEGTGGDHGRIKRQQHVIFEMLRKISSGLSMNQSLSFMEQIAPYIRTDIGPRFIINHWRTLNNLDFDSMNIQTLPGEGFFYEDIYYLRTPIENARIIIDSLID